MDDHLIIALIALVIGGIFFLLNKIIPRGPALPPPSPDERKVIDEFKKREKRQSWVIVPMAIILMSIGWNKLNPQCAMQFPLFLAVLGLAIGMFVFSFSNYKCPVCNKFVWDDYCDLKFCPKCKARLR